MKTWAREHCYYITKEAQSTITQTAFKNWCVMLSIQGLSGQYIQNNFSFTFHNSKYCFAQWATSDVQLYSLMITGCITNFQPCIWTHE